MSEKCEKRDPASGTSHCFCLSAPTQHLVPDHHDVMCCWCGEHRCRRFTREPVPGHGPKATSLVATPLEGRDD